MTGQEPQDDWAALGNDWREQAVSAVDVEALRDEVRRRGRRLRLALLNDLVGFALAMGLGVWALGSGRAGSASALIICLLVIVCGFQGWSLWIRRRQVSDSGLGALAMVELEIARARTSLLYWRVSIWVALAMVLALYAFAILAPVAPTDDLTMRGIVPSMVAVGLVCIGSGVWAWWLGRRTQARLVRLRRLQDEMRGS